MLKYNLYLNQILENIEKIGCSFKGKKKEDLRKNIDLIDMTLMRIQIIGECVSKLPSEIKNKYPKIRWNRIKDSRDIISHAYANVNLNIIWDLITIELPKLKEVINDIQAKEQK